MSLELGILIMLFSSIAPGLLLTGVYWSLLISGVLSITLGLTGKHSAVGFNTGVVLGSFIWVAVNFNSWGHSAVSLSVFQLILTVVTILAFTVASFFRPIESKNEKNN